MTYLMPDYKTVDTVIGNTSCAITLVLALMVGICFHAYFILSLAKLIMGPSSRPARCLDTDMMTVGYLATGLVASAVILLLIEAVFYLLTGEPQITLVAVTYAFYALCLVLTPAVIDLFRLR